MAKLHLLAENGSIASTIELTDELITIGRTEEQNLCIEDSSLSKHHGMLVRDGDDYQLHDFNSTNGSWVNGQRIIGVKLKDGDQVRFGFVQLRYESAPVKAAAPGVPVKLGGGTQPPVSAPKPLVTAAPMPMPPPKPVMTAAPVPRPSPTIAAPVASPAPTPPPTTTAPAPATNEDRVFIRIPSPPPVAAAQPASGLKDRLRSMVTHASTPLPLPPPVAADAPTPEPEPSPAPPTALAAKDDLSLKPSAPAPAGEKKLSMKPGLTPRDQIRLGPKKPSA